MRLAPHRDATATPAEEDRAKLEWLRSAVQEGVDDIERGDYTELRSRQDIERLLAKIIP